MTIETALRAVEAATRPQVVKPTSPPARFFLVAPDGVDPVELRARIAAQLAPLYATVQPISASAPRDLIIALPHRSFAGPESLAFLAGQAFEDAIGVAPVEPEIFHQVMPVETPGRQDLESVERFPPGCWVDDEPQIDADKSWGPARLKLPEAWKLSEAMGRPSRGEGAVLCQIDTGVVEHPELAGVPRASAYNVIGDGATREDPTDPLDYPDNPGHGTGTASVALSPETLEVAGAAPHARHLPIRAIESVVRISQTCVAEGIDRAVELGAHVISMSLGGIWTLSLQRAVDRAVAAAGNCVGLVVWPARFEDCIAVAGTDYHDAPWIGTCKGPTVAVSAPAQNVYRADVQTGKSGQGQGTSYAVALVAGVAACWLSHHGRAAVAAQARKRGETVQALFKRLLRYTARKPSPDWDAFNMGAGVVDALGLLSARLDAGLDMESPRPRELVRRGDESLRQFALEALGPAALGADIDWPKVGAETSLAIFRRQAQRGPALEAVGDALDLPLAVRRALMPAEAAPVASPAVVRTDLATAPTSKAVVQYKQMLAARHATEQRGGGGLESAGGAPSAAALEGSLPPEAPLPAPDIVMQRISAVIKNMPAREIGDPVAFRRALDIMFRHGGDALAKLPLVGLGGRSPSFSHGEVSALEAIVIADGSRPSFLLENGLPPQTHPFLGVWEGEMSRFRDRVQAVARCVGRVQPTNGSASNFIGTSSVIDAAKGLALTNFHVVDDARNRWLVPMTQDGDRLRVGEGLEVDFVGEAASFDQKRFRVVEILLPAGFGRGFGALDAAVLRLEPAIAGTDLGSSQVTLDASPAFANGGVQSLAVIGFPGPPDTSSNFGGGVNWDFVTRTLFGDLFGFKRIAPGKFRQSLGFDERDTLRSVFGNDPTTFGGSSGSLVLAWGQDGAPAFGLHFAGMTLQSNCAIAIAKAADALRKIGVPVV